MNSLAKATCMMCFRLRDACAKAILARCYHVEDHSARAKDESYCMELERLENGVKEAKRQLFEHEDAVHLAYHEQKQSLS